MESHSRLSIPNDNLGPVTFVRPHLDFPLALEGAAMMGYDGELASWHSPVPIRSHAIPAIPVSSRLEKRSTALSRKSKREEVNMHEALRQALGRAQQAGLEQSALLDSVLNTI